MDNLHITHFINSLKKNNDQHITFDLLKKQLLIEYPNAIFKEDNDNDICLICYNLSRLDILNNDQPIHNIVIDRQTLKIIFCQYNNIFYNNDAYDILNNKNTEWNKIIINHCIEGTMIYVFNHNNKWFTTTKKCLNATDSKWNKKISHGDMFIDALNNKINIEDLNPDNCYYFALIHPENINIVDYDSRKFVKIIMIVSKCDFKEISPLNYNNIELLNMIQHPLLLENINDINIYLHYLNETDINNNKITSEGIVLKVYSGEIGNSDFKMLKIRTNIYNKFCKLKPNNNNLYQIYLELFQKDELNEYLYFFNNIKHILNDGIEQSEIDTLLVKLNLKYPTNKELTDQNNSYINYNLNKNKNIILRISNSIKNISEEILKLYYITRKQQYQHLYNILPSIYKKILYDIHGIYINNNKKNANAPTPIKNNNYITIHDIYYYLKKILQSHQLREIFYERMLLIDNNEHLQFINYNCKYTIVQSKLMFLL
jgi:hypothetical protein